MKCQRCGYICYEPEAVCRNCGWHHDVTLIPAFRSGRSLAELDRAAAELERDRPQKELIARIMQAAFGPQGMGLLDVEDEGPRPAERKGPAAVLPFPGGRRGSISDSPIT